ncbi:hypothetical protein HZA99_06710 [Candidatus Woesearchaeota archaeon]|nr:hypothetical protein [Candidatus Woesearchaeota archaeon]
MKQIKLVMLVFLLLIFNVQTPVHSSSFIARVVDVWYPRQIACGQNFSVTVACEFEKMSYTDVAVLEDDWVVQSLTNINQHMQGNRTFVFNLTAPLNGKVWNLTATARAWDEPRWQPRGWYSDSERGAVKFSIQLIGAKNVTAENRVKKLERISSAASIVYWNHWVNKKSDVCVIWLGGGFYHQGINVNEFQKDSYNTRLFVQELSKSFGVLTSLQQLYNPTYVLRFTRDAMKESGYKYVVLMGYSMGGEAVELEVVYGDSESWKSDIAVFVTTNFNIPSYASKLRANLFLLYGSEMDEQFILSGKQFLGNATNVRYKDLKLIGGTAHEPWTLARTGEYDGRAVEAVIKFVEMVRSNATTTTKTVTPTTSVPTLSQHHQLWL